MAEIVVVGAGVVGTATGAGFGHHGHDVRFVDISPDRVRALRAEGLRATAHVEVSDDTDFVFLILPTPSGPTGYDLSALAAGTAAVGAALRHSNADPVVLVRSTVPPGTCDGLVRPLLEESSGRIVGERLGLASNPEFLRAASALEDFLRPWMTVLASRSPETLDRLIELFRPFGGEMRTFADPAAAELAKCAHNLFNATTISFWNEMWQVSRRFGLDADAVASTVSRSAEGSVNPDYGIRGGFPFDGSCLPKDVAGFIGFADGVGIELELTKAVRSVNQRMERSLRDEIDEAEGAPLYEEPLEPPPRR